MLAQIDGFQHKMDCLCYYPDLLFFLPPPPFNSPKNLLQPCITLLMLILYTLHSLLPEQGKLLSLSSQNKMGYLANFPQLQHFYFFNLIKFIAVLLANKLYRFQCITP